VVRTTFNVIQSAFGYLRNVRVGVTAEHNHLTTRRVIEGHPPFGGRSGSATSSSMNVCRTPARRLLVEEIAQRTTPT